MRWISQEKKCAKKCAKNAQKCAKKCAKNALNGKKKSAKNPEKLRKCWWTQKIQNFYDFYFYPYLKSMVEQEILEKIILIIFQI